MYSPQIEIAAWGAGLNGLFTHSEAIIGQNKDVYRVPGQILHRIGQKTKFRRSQVPDAVFEPP